MRIRTFRYFFKEALKSLYRNSWMGLASAGTVAVSLVIVGMSLLTVMNTNYLATRLEANVEIIAYIKLEVPEADAKALKSKITDIPGVAKVQFIDKDKALENFRKELGNQRNMIDALGGDNPLPNLYKISTISPEDVSKVADQLNALSEVEQVDYGKAVVDKLFSITKWVRMVGFTVVILLGLAAIFLIATTIRLTVFARRKEIRIMKILGATDWFVRWPFIMEGMILGLAGAMIAVILVDISYMALTDYVQRNFNLGVFSLQTDPQFMLILAAVMLAVGILIGVTGSIISIRKFLRV